jgi:RNA polymerase sigma-70 factor (ECF subfamily)
MSTSENVIVQKIINDDNFLVHKEFYDKYRKIVLNYIKSKYPNNNYLEDDVSEIMIKVFMGLKNFDPEKTKLKTWVINIAKNYMIDKWRSSKNIYNVDILEINALDSSSLIEAFEASNMINYLSNNMNPCEFSMLNMKYFYGYELKEIESEYNLNSGDAWGEIKKIKYKMKKSKLEHY